MHKVYVKELTHVFQNTKSRLIRASLEKGKKIFGACFPKLSGLLGFNLLPNRRIGTELADVAKRYGLKGILHSDELPNYGITEEEIKKVREELKCSQEDAFILLICNGMEEAKKVFRAIIERINNMIQTIPKDTRQVLKDGTTSFLRPQPGSARMYPETDHPLIYVERTEVNKENYKEIVYNIKYGDKNIKLKLAKLLSNDVNLYFKLKEDKSFFMVLDQINPDFRRFVLENLGFNKKQIEDLLWSEHLDFAEQYAKEIKPSLLYYLIFMLRAETKKEFEVDVKVDKEFLEEAVELLKKDLITKDALKYLLKLYNEKKESLSILAKKYNLLKIKDKEVIRRKIEEILTEIKDLPDKKKLNILINKLRYIADPRDIINIYNEIK